MLNYIHDTAKLVTMLYRFLAFVRFKDGNRPLNFEDENTFLGHEEHYKTQNSAEANKELDYGAWKESWIGSGKILERCRRAMSKAGNLVNRNQQIQFKNMINPEHEKYKPDAERVLYDIYKSLPGDEESAAFQRAKQVFGGHYDTLGYLFFVKDSKRFLPVSSDNFEKSLASIGVEYPLVGRCSWENYIGFLEIVKDVQAVMKDVIPDIEIYLIDAHSFLWIINEKHFREWIPDTGVSAEIEIAAEYYLTSKVNGNPIRRHGIYNYFSRNADVSRMTKDRANGICQLCCMPAPFKDKKGEPYLETHHIVWLSHGGNDSLDNTVALCPNCHTKMHIVNDKADVRRLLNL